MTRQEALAYRHKIENAAATQTDEAALQSIDLFPHWHTGEAVALNYRCQYNSNLYKCIQAHTTQEDWTPDITPALWAKVTLEEWPEWVRPSSAETAYNAGDKVTYNSKHYKSVINGNVWSPDEYPAGWAEQE